MLRQIFAIEDYRGLHPELMPSDVVFGKKTIVFGANGTGKSSISEFLRTSSSSLGAPSKFKSQRGVLGSRPQTWQNGDVLDFADIKVFNHFYVDDKLRGFLEADGQSETIFKLGNNAEAATAEINAAEQAKRYQQRHDAVQKDLAATSNLISDSEKKLKDSVVNTLNVVDSQKYSSYRFDIRAARTLLQAPKRSSLSPEKFLQYMSTAVMEAPKLIPTVPNFDSGLTELHAALQHGLTQSTSAIVIRELAENPKVAAWVAEGLKLHDADSTCKFCSSQFSADRLNRLNEHFDDSTAQARSQLTGILERCNSKLEELKTWKSKLPSEQHFYPNLQTKAETSKATIDTWSTSVERQLLRIKKSAQRKIDDFYAKVSSTALEATSACPLDEIVALISEHNKRATEHSMEVDTAVEAVLGHLSEPYVDVYNASVTRRPRLETLAKKLQVSITRFETAEARHKAAQTNATFMASLIDEDVRTIFGRADLEIVPSNDEKGYVVQRYGKPARHLSEGERKMIALSYFVRSLEADDVDRDRLAVVIDDPVSSLDRENMYAAFSWLQEKLSDLPQSIILTHDFELLRLYISGTSNQRKDSKKGIARGEAAESWFPRISFLEVHRCDNSNDPEKRIQLRLFPEFLLQHASEYHYLFHKVITTARSDGEDSLLPLVGNASRRLLEGFASFEAPAGTSFQEKIDMSCKNKVGEPLKNRVVKFAHGQSHRDNPNPTTGVDLPSVRSELQALLDLIKGCNDEHFERMCKATGAMPDW